MSDLIFCGGQYSMMDDILVGPVHRIYEVSVELNWQVSLALWLGTNVKLWKKSQYGGPTRAEVLKLFIKKNSK